MKRTLMTLVAALAFAGTASAATLSIDTDASSYLIGDTINVTVVLTTEAGDPYTPVYVQADWDGAVGSVVPFFDSSSQSPILTSFGGGSTWNNGTGLCGTADSCAILDQFQIGTTFAPDPPGQVITGTLGILASGAGALNLTINQPLFQALGLTVGQVSVGANLAGGVTVVPEPGTAAMVGLGLLGLASVGRRRN